MPGPPVRIASRANPRVKQLRAAFAGSPDARLSGGLVALEGEHLLFEAHRAGLKLQTIFVSDRRLAPAWVPSSVEIVELTEDVFASAVDTRSPQGIAALLVPPAWTLDDALPAATTPLLLVAAGLQDPGNLGTLIRSAHAFAATGVLTTPGTVSEWNPKVVRASAGSIFRTPVTEVNPAKLAGLKLRGLHLFAAMPGEPVSGRTVPVAEADLTQPCALLIGNEGSGLTAELLELADTRVSIPTPGGVESLNAAIAGSLLLYEASRQRANREASRQRSARAARA